MKTLLIVLVLSLISFASIRNMVANASVGPNVTTYTDSTAVNGQVYVYWVSAVGPACPAQPICGESAPSNFVAVQVPTNGPAPVLTWTPSTSSGTIQQNIYRASVTAPPSNLGVTP